MINSAITSSIMKSPVSVSAKAEPAMAAQKKTFQDILNETIYKKNAETPALFAADDEFTNYTETEPEEDIPDEVVNYAPEPQVKIQDDGIIYAEYIEIEINGRIVKQATDDFLTRLGYNVAALKANDLNADISVRIDENGFVPKYVIPLDLTWGIDYAMTVATPEDLVKTKENNAAWFGMATPVVAVNNKPINQGSIQKPSEKTENIAKTASNNVALSSVTSKPAVAVKNKPVRSDKKSPLKEIVKENRIRQSSVQKPVEKTESLAKMAANNAALRILSNLNILNVWDPKEKEEDEKK